MAKSTNTDLTATIQDASLTKNIYLTIDVKTLPGFVPQHEITIPGIPVIKVGDIHLPPGQKLTLGSTLLDKTINIISRIGKGNPPSSVKLIYTLRDENNVVLQISPSNTVAGQNGTVSPEYFSTNITFKS
jgi:hypothetical protein